MTPTNSAPAAPAPKRQRLDFLDAVRFTAMVLMIQGHTLDSLVRSDIINLAVAPWSQWNDLRGLTAPMFLLLSGIVGCLTLDRGSDGKVSKRRLRRRVLWGFGIMGLGYALVFPVSRLADLFWVSPELWRVSLRVNILHLNGAGLLVLTGLAALTRSDRAYAWWSGAIAGCLILGAPLMHGIDWFRYLPEAVAAYLTPMHGSIFPMFPCGAYLFLGAGLGAYLKAGEPGTQFARFVRACLCGALGSAVIGLLIFTRVHSFAAGPSGANPVFILARLGCTLLLIAGIAWAARKLPLLARCGRRFGPRSLLIYVTHLLILYGPPWANGLAQPRYRSLSLAQGLGAVLLVGALTFATVSLLDLLQRRAAGLWTVLRLSSAVVVILVLLF